MASVARTVRAASFRSVPARCGSQLRKTVRPHSALQYQPDTLPPSFAPEATEKFETLVRNELTFLPPGVIPGTFLMTLKPHHVPPKTYLQFYPETLRSMAEAIIPT
jgi:hypothetical protein